MRALLSLAMTLALGGRITNFHCKIRPPNSLCSSHEQIKNLGVRKCDHRIIISMLDNVFRVASKLDPFNKVIMISHKSA